METGSQWKWDKAHLTDPASVAKNIVPGTANYVKNEMLGLDDLSNLKKHAKEGNVWGALKSGLAGAAELGLTVATLGVGTGVKAAAKPAVKAAVKGAAKKTAATQAAKKAETTAAKPRYSDDAFAPKAEAKPGEGYPSKAKVEEKPKVKEEVVAKKGGKLGRAAAFGAGYALGSKGDGEKGSSTSWTPSGIV